MSCSPPIATIHTALLEEGQAIERVGFIKEGNCLAYAKVPNTPRPVQVRIQDTVMFVLPNAFSGVVKKNYILHLLLQYRYALVSLVQAAVLESYS